MKLLGLGAALACGAQLLYLTWPSTQGVVAACVSALLIWQLWSIRGYLNQHIDMLLLMSAYGGIGMLPLPGATECHVSTKGFLLMNCGMLVCGVPAMLYGARCMQQARREGRLTITLTADVLGMLAGMTASHYVTPVPPSFALLHHLSMLLGMLSGMGAARWVLFTVLRMREQVRLRSQSGVPESSSIS